MWRTFGLSAPLFINSGDFLQIEIYYNKKHLFLVELRFLDLGYGISGFELKSVATFCSEEGTFCFALST